MACSSPIILSLFQIISPGSLSSQIGAFIKISIWLFSYSMGGVAIAILVTPQQDLYMLISLLFISIGYIFTQNYFTIALILSQHFYGLFVAAVSASLARKIMRKPTEEAPIRTGRTKDFLIMVSVAIAIVVLMIALRAVVPLGR
jgi:hypothetical protein